MEQLMESAAARRKRVLREAVAADYIKMLDVYESIIAATEPTHHLQPPSLAQFTEWLGAAIHPPFVISEERQLLGWGVLRRFHPRAAYAPTGEVYLCVAPSSRRSGCGSSLLSAAVEGATHLELTSLACMIWGKPWLESWLTERGFQVAGLVNVDLPEPTVEIAKILQLFI
jgi:L-amino acid N-acyltransferase YncA